MSPETETLWAFARDVARLLAPVHAQDVAAEHLTASDLPDLLEALRERVSPVGGVDVEPAPCDSCAEKRATFGVDPYDGPCPHTRKGPTEPDLCRSADNADKTESQMDALQDFLLPDDEPREVIAEDLAAHGIDLDAAEERIDARVQEYLAQRREPDLSALLVPGWEMPEAPEDGAVATASYARYNRRWLLLWLSTDEQGPNSHGFIASPFREGVTVTADMLRALGFVVEGE